MKWKELLQTVAGESVFRTGFLVASGESLPSLRLQLSRWVRTGRLVQLKKGLYTVTEPYRNVIPHPFVLANAMKRASYVSLQSALGHFGMIPEHVPTVTSVTTQRPERVDTQLGQFIFRRIRKNWFCGYQQVDLGSGQRVFVATPEKALLDIVYLTPGADSYDFLAELRLQSLESLDLNALRQLAEISRSAKLRRAVKHIAELVEQEAKGEL
jgi:predicted transcriptional regulator of viral defense system